MPLINDWEVPLLFEGDKEFFAKSFRTLSNDLNKQVFQRTWFCRSISKWEISLNLI